MRHKQSLFASLVCLSLLASCSNPHFFPRTKPLFAGLDESKVSAPSRAALAHAKEDFRLAQQGKAPRHARLVTGVVCRQQQLYEGDGYLLTVRDDDQVRPQEHGVRIVLEARLTGGRPFRYDDIDRSED